MGVAIYKLHADSQWWRDKYRSISSNKEHWNAASGGLREKECNTVNYFVSFLTTYTFYSQQILNLTIFALIRKNRDL